MKYANLKIAKEIQVIFQDNLKFLILDNIGKFEVVKSCFDNLVQNIESADSINRLEIFYDDFFDSLNIENEYTKVTDNVEYVWKVYSFVQLFQRAVIYSPKFIHKFLKVLRFCIPFFSDICKDTVIEESKMYYQFVIDSQKYQNTATSKKFSILDALSGFFERDSSSEEEDTPMPQFSRRTSKDSMQV